tara:strand:- start:104 stop:652 length:549 start_codon:yes stop_codon:yes gene_type:complete
MTEMSIAANNKAMIDQRKISLEQLDKCYANGEVQARFKRYVERGRSFEEGPMAETEALEEALMDVFVGAKNRGFRFYQKYATEEHVKRFKRVTSNTHNAMKLTEYVPDMVGLRARLRKTSDMGMLANLLAAEQSGRNDTNEPREEAIRAIVARISAVQKNEEAVSGHGGASEEELAAAKSKA